MLFQEILQPSYGSQVVNSVYMYPNTQCKNENQGQGSGLLVKLSIHATVEQTKFFQLQSISISAETTQIKLFWG